MRKAPNLCVCWESSGAQNALLNHGLTRLMLQDRQNLTKVTTKKNNLNSEG